MKNITSKSLRSLMAVLAIFGLESTHASVVYTQTLITGDSQIFNNGTLVQANNLGGGPATTINGLSFGTSTTGLGANNQNRVWDNYSQAPFSDELDDLLDSHVINTVWWNSAFEYGNGLTISGLTVGRDYRLQLFMANDGGADWDSRFTLEGTQIDLLNWMPNGALNLAGVWTAADATMNLTIGTINSGAHAGYTIISGYALHDVTGVDPIPSSSSAVPLPGTLGMALLGLAGLRLRKQLAG